MATPTLDEMERRAQRHLDGMTVNRDAMALDVLRLTAAIRSAQKRAAEQTGKTQRASPFADLFDGLFWGR